MTTVYISTMRSNEPQFERSQASIDNLNEHFRGEKLQFVRRIYTDLGEVEAHQQLYQDFHESGAEWLFKVDADMEVYPDSLEKLMEAAVSAELPAAVGRLADYITRAAIWGLWLYHRDVNWQWEKFVPECPQPDLLHEPGLRWAHIYETLGIHCWRPSSIQAFHYGYHKVIQRKNQESYFLAMLDHLMVATLGRYPEQQAVYMACLGACQAFRDPSAGTSYGPWLHDQMRDGLLRQSSPEDVAKELQQHLEEHYAL